MSTVSETIPVPLQPDVDAALEWFNRDQAIPFEVTGILDPDAAPNLAGTIEAVGEDLSRQAVTPRRQRHLDIAGERATVELRWPAGARA